MYLLLLVKSHDAKHPAQPLSLSPLILDPLFFPVPFPRCNPLQFSPLGPIMDFSCDIRKKNLLLECIDYFNGREQRAKRGGKKVRETLKGVHRVH